MIKLEFICRILNEVKLQEMMINQFVVFGEATIKKDVWLVLCK